MTKSKILLGFEVGTGERIEILPSHLIVTGLTAKAGKTTTLESLIVRSKRRAICFKTKVGERSFLSGTVIPPYFKDRSDWQFVEGLLEATIKEKLRSFDRAKIIQLTKKAGNNSLLDFKKQVDARLLEKINGFEKDILTNLQAYLEIVLPKLLSIKFSNSLELVDGLNIIDLERFSRDSEVQSLIIRSVLEEVLYKFKDVIIVIPESWKFIPQDRGNPCKLMVEEFIRQGATNGNFIWIDSQDMSGVDKTPLKQISEWILGLQSEINEVKHTLNEIPLPKAQKPKAEDIMTLGTGMFYLATRERTVKVYVLPFWLDEEKGRKVAMGQLSVDDLDAPRNMTPFKIRIDAPQRMGMDAPMINYVDTFKRFEQELIEMREDFFNKIADVQGLVNAQAAEIYELKTRPAQVIDENAIVSKVLQKMPVSSSGAAPIDKEGLLREILARVPAGGNVTYTVAPLEKIKKDFLEVVRNKIVADVRDTSVDAKTVLKYLEVMDRDVSPSELITKCLLLKVGGSQSTKMTGLLKELVNAEVAIKTPGARYRGALRFRISSLMGNHSATEQEIEQVYNSILSEVIQ